MGIPVYQCGGGGDPNLDNTFNHSRTSSAIAPCRNWTICFERYRIWLLSSTLIHVSWIWCIMLTDFISWVQTVCVVKAPFVLKHMYDFDAGTVWSVSLHKDFSFYEQRFECHCIQEWMGKAPLMKMNYLWSPSFYVAVWSFCQKKIFILPWRTFSCSCLFFKYWPQIIVYCARFG